jgi:O-antigen/teichoic acid export membrane protein
VSTPAVAPDSRPGSGSSRRIARNTFARASGEAVAKAASLVLYVTMARELGSEGFGTFMFALALTGALIIGAGFGTDELTAREVARDRSRASRYLSNVTAIKALTSIVLLGVAVALVALGDYSTESRLAVCIVGVGVALEVMSRTSYALFEAHERLGLVSRSVIIQRVLTAIVGIAVLRAGGGVVAVSFVFAAGALVGLVAAEVSVRRLGVRRTTPEPSSWPALVRAGLPIGLAGLLFVLLLRLDVTLLSFIAGEAEVGFYAAAYRLVEGTQFIAWAASAAMLPWLARAEGAGAWFGLSRALELGLKVLAALLLPVTVACIVFAEQIVDLLYGAGFRDSVAPLQLLALTCTLYGVQALLSTAFIARDSPWAFARLVGVAVVLNVVANLLLIPPYGAAGSAAAALASSLALTILGLALTRRRVGRIRLPRAFGGPLVAALVMAAVGSAVPGPFVLRAAAAFVAYVVVLIGFERAVFTDDTREIWKAIELRASPAPR